MVSHQSVRAQHLTNPSHRVSRAAETEQTFSGVARIKAWAEEIGELTEDDLLISASVDEEGYSYSVTLLEWIFKKIITALNVAFITKIKIMFFNCKYSFKIMSRSALHKLKWCQVTDEIISGGLWTPLGNFNKVRRLKIYDRQ